MEQLTDIQKKVLNIIKEFHLIYGYPPSIREIAEKLNYSSTKAIFVHLKNLEKKGYIKRNRKARSIEINNYKNISLIGVISAGKPLLGEQYREEEYKIPNNIRGKFFLRINGDSMIDIGFQDKDLVLIETDSNIKNHDIIVAIINGETIVKRFIKKKDIIILRAENKNYNDIYVKKEDEFNIIGKVIGHMKLL